jgi:hypothetical protein
MAFQIRRVLRDMRESMPGRIIGMAIAQVGPFTAIIEGLATAVGAGVVLGSVAAGLFGLARGWSRRTIGDRGLTDGYLGGAIGAVAVFADLCLRYAA